MGTLSRNHRLWVPMQVQSLVFGRRGSAAFLDLTPRYEKLADTQRAPLGCYLRPDLSNTTPRPPFLPPGIHLHWMLPAAFTHLRPGSAEPPPRVPNRWLVTRLWLQAGRLELRCWVVESDSVTTDDDDNPSAVPWFDDQLDPALTIGLCRSLQDWHEPGTADPGFSAFAPGNLGFAASYPACRGVFGFHDDCSGLPEDSLCTYLVNGWFSDPAADPLNLAGAQDAGAWAEQMQKLRWSMTQDPPFLPMSVTCYAIAPGIRWTPEVRCTAAAQPDLPVAVAGSFPEAVAALARRNGSADERDGFVKLHQLAVLDARRPTAQDLDAGLFQDLDRLPAAQARLHQCGFSARDGGTLWDIVPARKAAAEPEAPAATPALPPDLAAKRAELNRLQAALDAAERGLAAAREQLFLAWSQHQYWTIRPTGKASDAEARILALELATRSAEVRQAIADLPAAQARRDSLKDRIAARLDQDNPRAFKLTPRAMPRFWRPADPFVLTSGLEVPMLQGGASPLLCRSSDQTIPRIGGRQPLSRDMLRDWLEQHMQGMTGLPPGHADLPADWTELLLDTLFLDSSMARVLAQAALSASTNDPDETQIAAARDTIAAVQKPIRDAVEAVNRGPSVPSGLPFDLPDTALRALLSAVWPASTPPRPVFMVWQARWRRLDRQGWTLAGDAADFSWSGTTPAAEDNLLEGFLPLATGLEQGLEPKRAQFPEQSFVFKGLTRLAGQGLAGLTQALATRDAGAQLQPLRRVGRRLSADPIGEMLADQPVTGPLTGDPAPSAFSPLRGGEIMLTRLWIVDSFGRVQRLIDAETDAATRPAPVIARGLAPRPDGTALLPPRLLQHARLRLEWQAARDGDTSPICGFVLHNRLDRSLLIYGAGAGDAQLPDRFVGALQPVRLDHGNEVMRWSAMPARPLDGSLAALGPAPLAESDIPDPRLRGFVNGLLGAFGSTAGREFQDFRTLLAGHQEGAAFTSADGLQAMLAGRPLALARAAVWIELEAPPVADQHRRAILAADPAAPPWFRGLGFPLRLGDRRLGPEGLLGAFVDGDSASAFQALRLRADLPLPKSLDGHRYVDRSALTVPLDPEAAPLSLVLLIDPQRPLNLATGILPAASFQIPQDAVTAAAAGLEIPFLVAPLLAELASASGRAMPLPTSSHDEWRWSGFPDRISAATEEPVSGDTAAAGGLQAEKALHEGWLRYRPTKRGMP